MSAAVYDYAAGGLGSCRLCVLESYMPVLFRSGPAQRGDFWPPLMQRCGLWIRLEVERPLTVDIDVQRILSWYCHHHLRMRVWCVAGLVRWW